MEVLPIFPLGSVLFPGGVLPLQVFEPRYQQLVADLPGNGNRFGVVLIRRGHEVGGGDERHDIGTIARVFAREDLGDGLSLLTAVGQQRFRVTRWLVDDPYPQAEVEVTDTADVGPELDEAISRVSKARQQLIAIAIELGADGQQLDLQLPADRQQAAWVLCAMAPVGSFDRQRLLEIDDPTQRLDLLETMLHAQTEDLHRIVHP